MEQHLLQQLSRPHVRPVTHKGTVIAQVRFFNHADFPGFKIDKDFRNWWEIARLFAQKERGRDWKRMTAAQQSSDVKSMHSTMFPKWTDQLYPKHITAPGEKELFQHIQKHVIEQHTQLPLSKQLKLNVYPRLTVDSCNRGAIGDAIRSAGMISLFVDGNKGWNESLRNTFAHEYMHLACRFPLTRSRTLTDKCVLEGLAIHYSQYIMHTNKCHGDFVRLSYKKTYELLQRDRYWLHRRLSLAKGTEYLYDPIGVPHSVGYVIVGLFLNSLKTISWNQITRIPPEEIMRIGMWALKEKL